MIHSTLFKSSIIVTLILSSVRMTATAQALSGVWKGRIGNSRVELKLIRKGDSIVGTSYYYESKSHYRRYSIKGYFDDRTMEVVWWDDALIIDGYAKKIFSGSPDAVMAVADFNCPGEGVLKLDGKTTAKDRSDGPSSAMHLTKIEQPVFPDEWDFVISNYALGANDPGIIDSISRIAMEPVQPVPEKEKTAVAVAPTKSVARERTTTTVADFRKATASETEPVELSPAAKAETNQERFTARSKILQHVIPLEGDSIELRFYDNAEIDGDSIAVFLNGKMIREHILLSDQAYSIMIPVASLEADNELVMVAENLGSIPPNTSLMVAVCGEKKYEAFLRSTEGSSALVRLVKPISPH